MKDQPDGRSVTAGHHDRQAGCLAINDRVTNGRSGMAHQNAKNDPEKN